LIFQTDTRAFSGKIMSYYQVQTALRRLGRDIRVARKKRRMSVADFCERLGVTDKTLAKLETGDGGVRLETLAMALMVLGELHRLGEMLDPAKDDTGLVLDQARLPERIAGRRKPSSRRSATRQARSDGIDDEGSAF
jgi:transcriptional regulator with XRE-family HTH domain